LVWTFHRMALRKALWNCQCIFKSGPGTYDCTPGSQAHYLLSYPGWTSLCYHKCTHKTSISDLYFSFSGIWIKHVWNPRRNVNSSSSVSLVLKWSCKYFNLFFFLPFSVGVG
jgi:hypothetical protein